MAKIIIEVEVEQAKAILEINNIQISEWKSKIGTLEKQNETLKKAINNGAPVATSVKNEDENLPTYPWRDIIREYFEAHKSKAGARIIADYLFEKENVTNLKYQQHIRNRFSIALSTMCGRGKLVKAGKSNGEQLYEIKKETGE